MKKQLKVFGLLLVAIVAVVCVGMYGVDGVVGILVGGGGLMLGDAIVGPGVSVNGTVTSEELKTNGILEEDLNKLIVKVRPSDVPLDTLTREIGNVKSVQRNECGGYEIGTRDIDDTLLIATGGLNDVENIKIGKKSMWQVSDTIFIPGVLGSGDKPLMLLVVGKDNANATLQVIAVNPVAGKIPIIAQSSGLLRLGKAMSEIDAQTEAFSALPSPRINYTQIAMTQIEESVIAELSKKKVSMDFSTHKELAIWDMKRSMELTNLFGVKGMTIDPVKNKPVYTSDGLWNQLTRKSTYVPATAPTNKFFVGLTKEIFDGNNGSERRVLLAGPDLIEYLSQVEGYAKQLEAKNVEIVHGVRFNRIITNFGELLVKSMSGLFTGNMAKNGMVLDMSYIIKYVFEPLQTKELDLDSSGQRRVKAVRLLENYALFAENLDVHRKITPA